MTGLEIECNLVDADYQPHFHNAQVLHAIADESYQTELAPTTSNSTCRRGRCPATPRSSSRPRCAPASTPPTARPRRCGSNIVMIGILPTLMPEHYEGEWMSRNNRYKALNDSIFIARGEDINLDIEGPTGERVATYCDSIAPESACTSVQLHLQVAPCRVRRALERRPGAGRPAARAGRQLARTSSASGCSPRPASSCSRRPPTPGRSS